MFGHTWELTKIRIRLAMRNRAFFFFSLVMPLIFLFGAVALLSRGSRDWVPYILGAVLTTTVMGSFWGLSVQLVTFREQGILRRFRLAPLGAGPMLRWRKIRRARPARLVLDCGAEGAVSSGRERS